MKTWMRPWVKSLIYTLNLIMDLAMYLIASDFSKSKGINFRANLFNIANL